MAEPPKVIITCAVTGAIHTPSMSPYLPATPDQIAEASIGAAKAGAAIAAQVHRAGQIIEGVGTEVATPADAREILSLKGAHKVAF